MSTRDKDVCLMTDTAVTASAATTDYIALGATENVGDPLYMVATCTTTCDSANDTATVVLDVQVDGDTGFSNPTTLASSGPFAIASATLTAGGRIVVPIPHNPVLSDKYMRAYFTVGTQNLTAGKFTVEVMRRVQTAGL